VAGVPVQAVRFRRGDAEQVAWAGARNAPVIVFDDEPPRTGWPQFARLADHLGGPGSVLPAVADDRVRVIGLLNELAGEDGLGWSSRLLMIHGSLVSGGARSFPLPVAQYLARDYGYAPEKVDRARIRVADVMTTLRRQLARSHAAGHAYLVGDRVTALDVYAATFLTPLVGVSEDDCPAMLPLLRPAFVYLRQQVEPVPEALAAHRRFMFERHLAWPIAL
jgi:glutathione S-transferase